MKCLDIRAGYPREPDILKGITAEFPKGLNVIIGPNGAGKSTFLKYLAGFIKGEGEIHFAGTRWDEVNYQGRMEVMGYLPQIQEVSQGLLLMEVVMLGLMKELSFHISDEVLGKTEGILRDFHIDSLAMKPMGELSGGQQRLGFIAGTMIRKPDLLLLDEPLNGLDLRHQMEVMKHIAAYSRERTVIMVLHDLNIVARWADHIVALKSGGTLYGEGTPGELITEKTLWELYGVRGVTELSKDGTPMVHLLG